MWYFGVLSEALWAFVLWPLLVIGELVAVILLYNGLAALNKSSDRDEARVGPIVCGLIIAALALHLCGILDVASLVVKKWAIVSRFGMVYGAIGLAYVAAKGIYRLRQGSNKVQQRLITLKAEKRAECPNLSDGQFQQRWTEHKKNLYWTKPPEASAQFGWVVSTFLIWPLDFIYSLFFEMIEELAKFVARCFKGIIQAFINTIWGDPSARV